MSSNKTTDTKKLRIVHIIPSSASGGAPKNVGRFIKYSRHTNNVIIQKDDNLNFDYLSKISNQVFNTHIRSISLSAIINIYKLCKKHADVIHTHGKGAGLYGRIVGLALRKPVFHTYRGYHNLYKGTKSKIYLSLERQLSKLMVYGFAVSKSEEKKIIRDNIAQPNKLVLLPNPIEIQKKPINPIIKLQDRLINIVSIARISHQKDIITTLEVAKKLGNGYFIHIFGGTNSSDTKYEEKVQAKIKDEKIDNVKLYGDISSIASNLYAFDLYLSTALWEGLPTAIIEAFLSKVPVIASDSTGNVDVVLSNKTGKLCPMQNVNSFVEAITEISNNKDLREKIIKEAYELATLRFNPKNIAISLDNHYSNLLNR